MTNLALKLILVWGWRRLFVAVCLGMLAATAMAPLSLWPVLFVSLPVLIWLLDGVYAQSQTRRARLMPALWTGWGFGFGYFAVSLFWIGEAFLVDAETFAWALPFAVTLMPAGLALFWGGGAMLAMAMWQPGFGRILAFAAGLSLFEWLRGTVFTGFPWNTLGYAADTLAPIAQLASITGVFGLTFLVIVWCAAPAALADDSAHYSQRLTRGASLLMVLISLIGVFAYGNWRLAKAEALFHDTVQLRIVQPNIAQRDKWQVENREAIFARYLKLTRAAASEGPASPPTHVIWPESALPVLIGELPKIRKEIAGLIATRPMFIMGALTRVADTADAVKYSVFNSVIAIDGNGDVAGEYHKQKLVPFGEYLPLANWLEPLGLRKLVTMPLGFKPGNGPQTLAPGTTPRFAPLVCYEAIFPHRLSDASQRPEWLLNVTNDAWFGRSFGPYQHFAQARMRALEDGLPLVRAANTGISAVVDPYGRILHRLDLNTQGVINAKLPLALSPTIYANYGNYAFFLMIGLAFLTVYGHFSWRGGLIAENGRS